MDRYEKARNYHKRGFNCCQSVLASFTDLTGMSEQECFDIAGGFGAGAGTGELCGAITGAAMTLGRLTPVDPADPCGQQKADGGAVQRAAGEIFREVRRSALPGPAGRRKICPR